MDQSLYYYLLLFIIIIIINISLNIINKGKINTKTNETGKIREKSEKTEI